MVDILGILGDINPLLAKYVPGYADKINQAAGTVQPVANNLATSAFGAALKKYWWALALIPVSIIVIIILSRKKKF